MSNSELPAEDVEVVNEQNSEPARICTRKASRSTVIVTISSDSENEGTSEKKESKQKKPSENEENSKGTKLIPDADQTVIKGDIQIKVESSSEEEDDDKKDPTYSNSSSKTEKSGLRKELISHKISSKSLTMKRNTHFKRKTKLLQQRFLKNQAAKNASSTVRRLSSKRKSFSTSYLKKKRKLLTVQKTMQRPVGRGRPRKYFDHMPNKNQLKSTTSTPSSRKSSIDESSVSDKINEKLEIERKNSTEKNFKESTPLNISNQFKKRGRPKLKLIVAKRKRGRPRLIENRVLVHKKTKPISQPVSDESKKTLENPSIKKRGRPKLVDTEMSREKKKTLVFKSETYTKPVFEKPKKSSVFIQNVNCLNDIMKIPKCRECRKAAYNRSTWDMSNSYCRFLEYRKLLLSQNGAIICAGFLQPNDSTKYEKFLWLPNLAQPPSDLTVETAKRLLIQVGDQFCDLVEQEKEALLLHIGLPKSMTWKKLVQGVREMCDVCETTLFNIHWVCPKCGFAVCIDCYKVRKQGIPVEHDEEESRSKDEFLWLYCHNKVSHEQKNLIMAQIVPSDALWTMNESMHWVRKKHNVEANCKCMPRDATATVKNSVDTGICKQLMSTVSKSFSSIPVLDKHPFADDISFLNIDVPDRATEWINHGYDENLTVNEKYRDVNNKASNFSCLEMIPSFADNIFEKPEDRDDFEPLSVNELLECLIEYNEKQQNKTSIKKPCDLFNSRYPQTTHGQNPLRIFTVTESSVPFKDIPHSWLCCGRLLLLHQPDHVSNIRLFQEQWKRGQPIMVMGIDTKLDMSLWHPEGFCRDFGDVKNDLVNCMTGVIIPNLPMKKFWLGFENFNERMKDDHGNYMLLKLKDWPPGEDFSEKLPKRFQDLMRGLPLPEYTHRDGVFNLAGRLPSWFVRPDLGPKMYNAYGSALFPTKGTTNLHLDISDAVNVMVYVGIPHDGKDEQHILEALKAIDEGGCDSLTKERVRSKGVRPGALWHIYDSKSADKIRALLTKVAIERGEKLEAHHDPIHDQNWYLDTELRKRLQSDYGVEGYAIAQCLGDAVFIPAGAPHQVRNLHSCVKVAEDFVSPENIAHCFKLTQEFRHLSDTHTNHEDKLQIKNIIYHVVKDALSHLLNKEEFAKYILKRL